MVRRSRPRTPVSASTIIRRFGEESLARLGSELLSQKIRVETILCEGIDPAAEILEAARDRSIDLLVIGTRGHKGLARLVLGSTAEELIHQARCPILAIGPAVPAPKQPVNFQRIVYATDFSPEAAKACVFALSFAQDFGAHLYLCHVLPEGNDQMNDQELNDRFTSALRRPGSRRGPGMVRAGMCSRARGCDGWHSAARPACEGRSHRAGHAQDLALVRQFQNRGRVPGDQQQHLSGA